MGLDAVDATDVGHAGPLEGIGDGSSHVGQHVLVAGRALELVGQGQTDGAVTPAGDARHLGEVDTTLLRPRGGGRRPGEHHTGGAVGHLAAVGASDPTIDGRVRRVVAGEALGGVGPRPGLSERVVLRVAEVQLGDRGEVQLVDAVAAVVLVREQAEHVGPDEGRGLGLVSDPRRRTQVARCLVTGHVALLLGAEHERAVVAAGLDLRHRGEHRDATRCARGFVPGGGQAPQPRLDRRRHGTEVALAVEDLAERVADVHRGDVGGVDPGGGERAVDRLGDQVADLATLLGDVAGEVALDASEDVHVGGHGPLRSVPRVTSSTVVPSALEFPSVVVASRPPRSEVRLRRTDRSVGQSLGGT